MSCAGFLGLSLLLLAIPGADTPPRTGYSALLVATTIIPLLAIAGHLGNVPELYGLSPVTGIGLHTAIGLLALAIGIASSTHRAALVDLVTSREPGTVLLRRLLPLAVLLPILFAVGSIQALRLGFYQVHVGPDDLRQPVHRDLALGPRSARPSVARRLEAGAPRGRPGAGATRAAEPTARGRGRGAGRAAGERGAHPRAARHPEPRAGVPRAASTGGSGSGAPGAERLYGWSSEEAIRAGADDLLQTELPVPQREAEAALLEQRRMARGAHAAHARRHHPPNRHATGSSTATPPGSPDAVIEVDDDVTEQRRAEELRSAAARRATARWSRRRRGSSGRPPPTAARPAT